MRSIGKQIILLVICIVYMKECSTENVFKIGSLLPDIKSLRSLSSHQFDLSDRPYNYDLSIANAIHFASKKLSNLLLKEYGCSLKLDPASTRVCEFSYIKWIQFIVHLLNITSLLKDFDSDRMFSEIYRNSHTVSAVLIKLQNRLLKFFLNKYYAKFKTKIAMTMQPISCKYFNNMYSII